MVEVAAKQAARWGDSFQRAALMFHEAGLRGLNMVKLLVYFLATLFVGAMLADQAEQRTCRMGWGDISEYAALTEVCRNPAARAALIEAREW